LLRADYEGQVRAALDGFESFGAEFFGDCEVFDLHGVLQDVVGKGWLR
jgi:hypothetical protein